jgi:metal-responsive CopG/Arc/MetJ family transcriptional regulator
MRTIVDLPGEELRRLQEICRKEGISRAEAIRRAVAQFTQSLSAAANEEAFGIWSFRHMDGRDYEDELRREWDTPSQ